MIHVNVSSTHCIPWESPTDLHSSKDLENVWNSKTYNIALDQSDLKILKEIWKMQSKIFEMQYTQSWNTISGKRCT